MKYMKTFPDACINMLNIAFSSPTNLGLYVYTQQFERNM